MMLLLVLAVSVGAEAQKRFTVSLQGMAGRDYSTSGALHRRTEWKLLPSIAYHLSPSISIGLTANLPLRDNGVFSSTGGELWVGLSTPSVAGFKLTLAPTVGYGIIGAYSHSIKNHWSNFLLGETNQGSTPFDRDYLLANDKFIYTPIKERWHVGIRPTLTYTLNDRWGFTLSWGFLGYISHSEIDNVHLYPSTLTLDMPKQVTKSPRWGFTSSAVYSSALRLGISYSF